VAAGVGVFVFVTAAVVLTVLHTVSQFVKDEAGHVGQGLHCNCMEEIKFLQTPVILGGSSGVSDIKSRDISTRC
jgi:hypothetical protein